MDLKFNQSMADQFERDIKTTAGLGILALVGIGAGIGFLGYKLFSKCVC